MYILVMMEFSNSVKLMYFLCKQRDSSILFVAPHEELHITKVCKDNTASESLRVKLVMLTCKSFITLS